MCTFQIPPSTGKYTWPRRGLSATMKLSHACAFFTFFNAVVSVVSSGVDTDQDTQTEHDVANLRGGSSSSSSGSSSSASSSVTKQFDHRSLISNETENIYGGEPTTGQEYPFFVHSSTESGLECGGSLVAPDMVMTAAHCYCTYIHLSWMFFLPCKCLLARVFS
jgi:V8-like Glu-specific endopeptidase